MSCRSSKPDGSSNQECGCKGFACPIIITILLAAVVACFACLLMKAPIQEDFEMLTFLEILGSLLIIVLLIERFLEIAVYIWRGGREHQVQERIRAARAELEEAEAVNSKTAKAEATKAEAIKKLAEAEKAGRKFEHETRWFTLALGYFAGVIVAGAGVGVLENIVEYGECNAKLLRGVDIVLTAGLLGGGSDYFHQFTGTLQDSVKNARKRLKAESEALDK